MYAIIEFGGRQYRLDDQATLRMAKIEALPGEKVSFDKVLAVREDSDFRIGAPYVAGAQVECTVIQQGRGAKIRIMKFKRKKHYKKQAGHRQDFTAVRVDSIVA